VREKLPPKIPQAQVGKGVIPPIGTGVTALSQEVILKIKKAKGVLLKASAIHPPGPKDTTLKPMPVGYFKPLLDVQYPAHPFLQKIEIGIPENV
jgi:hypothetical protein